MYLSLSSLVNGPTPALLKYLRSRLPENEGVLAFVKFVLVYCNQFTLFKLYISSFHLDSEASTTKEDLITMATRLSVTSKVLLEFFELARFLFIFYFINSFFGRKIILPEVKLHKVFMQ